MRKILALLLIVMFLTLPSLITPKQVSAIFATNNSLAPKATLLWNYTTSNGVWSSPAVVNGVVYVGSEDIFYTGAPYGTGPQYGYVGNFYALNAANGHKLWNYSIPDGGSSPAIADGMVYVGSFDSNVYALNASNGG
jgi:outer membrane protein assembly factor BamB